jgi:hypothetical protein
VGEYAVFMGKCILSPSKKSLGKCGDEADLDEEAYDRFQGSKGRDGITKRKGAWEEATPVKCSDAEDQSFPWWEMSKHKVADGEAYDHEEVYTEAPPRFVSIACQHIEKP